MGQQHRMMQDKVHTPWQTWTVADEILLEALANEYPFLRRLPYRFDERYGPPIRAPWEASLSPKGVRKEDRK